MKGKSAAVVGVLAVAWLSVVALSGQTAPECQPVTPSPGQVACESASDCEGLPHILCDGAWKCEKNACLFQCGDVEIGCYGDEDCPAAQHCSVSDGECGTPPGCDPGQPCPAVCYGKCVDDESVQCVVSGCSSEICAQEPLASFCVYLDWYQCLAFSQCGPFGASGACGWEETPEFKECMAGFEVDPEGKECWDDSGCPYGYYCELTPESGVCKAYLEYGNCKGDVDCPKGFHCDPCGCPDDVQCFACIPNCLPNEDCSFDEDCPDGQACQVTDPCGPPPGCEPGDDCPAVCWPYGFCVVAGQPKCKKTGCSGQLCASQDIMTTCEWMPHYACYQQFGECGNFGPDGSCLWNPTVELEQCLMDTDGLSF